MKLEDNLGTNDVSVRGVFEVNKPEAGHRRARLEAISTTPLTTERIHQLATLVRNNDVYRIHTRASSGEITAETSVPAVRGRPSR